MDTDAVCADSAGKGAGEGLEDTGSSPTPMETRDGAGDGVEAGSGGGMPDGVQQHREGGLERADGVEREKEEGAQRNPMEDAVSSERTAVFEMRRRALQFFADATTHEPHVELHLHGGSVVTGTLQGTTAQLDRYVLANATTPACVYPLIEVRAADVVLMRSVPAAPLRPSSASDTSPRRA
eukprot:TRINITY_DN7385_c0_g1_i1.p1 TRINITY_DN7385_c0_g1~~TRINITY_DN7385_c0_g1_i1.p1  ORF type:complete len:181 (-),score=35.75 TRINITY_DN7385_c0_g1_i1:176-718(-)